ncbi:unnamed protein product [Paramecium octaurelia]|uniref:RING-type domain-containing protein n=1 Tax=Paramecium octaurelia TaxID=43137 RepID=A0A8S1TQQ5_PAROT|nr:unnamed protein product [Paramecium octaurelia]
MNQLQLSQAQSPRESNFDYEEQPQIQSIQLHQRRAALQIITNVILLIQRIQIQILVAIFQIFLILFNSYIAFDLSYKISILYVTILHFLQIIKIGVYNNKQSQRINFAQKVISQLVLLHLDILGSSLHFVLPQKGCLIYFLENEDFPIQYPILMHLIFTLTWFVLALHTYLKNKNEKSFILVLTVLLRFFLVLQLMMINLKQIQWIDWEWLYVFTILWIFLSIICIFQIIFLFDFICKAAQFLSERDPLNRESINQQIIGSLWINLLVLCISGLPTFSMVCYTIKLSTGKDSYNSLSITLSVIYSLVFIVFTLYYRMALSLFVSQIQQSRGVESNIGINTDNLQRYRLNSPSSKHKNHLIKSKDQILIQLPQYLIRLSQTYFLPAINNDNSSQLKQSQQLQAQQQHIKKNKTDSEQPKLSNRVSLTEINSDKDTQCFNCYQNESCAVYMPCGHGGLCVKCATEWFTEKQECLICRKPVESVVKVSQSEQNKVQVIDVLAF